MESIDLQVLQACVQWLQQGQACEYVTVVRTWGSSPRPAGSTMAIRGDGVVVGSVSGGCIEDDLIAHARADGLVRRLPQRLVYGISADDAHRFGLPCGGTVELLVEPLAAHSQMPALLARLQRRSLTRRRLDLGSGEVTLEEAGEDEQLRLDEHALTTIHGPRLRLLIIGAGQLSQFLAQIASVLDYQVTVCDPREEHRLAWSLPGVSVLHAMPDDLVLEMRLDRRSAVVALTHDPRLDDMALMEALKTDAFYIGAIGSRLNQSRRRERLLQLDLDAHQIAKLHGPVGLDIGSRTPHEIAISIMAEMIRVRNSGSGRARRSE